jgi:hypothetical protein
MRYGNNTEGITFGLLPQGQIEINASFPKHLICLTMIILRKQINIPQFISSFISAEIQ